jgi:hypothetical protein
MDGRFVKDRDLNALEINAEVRWNWDDELVLFKMDHFRFDGYLKKCLEEYAGTFGVENKDFELEKNFRVYINVARKSIQHIVYEDGITFDRMSYIFPKVLNWLDHPHHYLLVKKLLVLLSIYSS